MYGWDFPERPATRIRQMEEAVRLILAMWADKRTTFHGKYFRAEDAILEPKPVQRPHPPVMIAGGGETMTLRVVAKLGDACNVFGDPAEVKRKFDILRGHCETEGRPYEAIEKTVVLGMLVARDAAALAAKQQRLGLTGPLRGVALTVSQVADLMGQYQAVGLDLMIVSAMKNDPETLELIASDIIPRFA
jgi:alkanesulfonate monooxygenase SsuD/methylene tetrahydromethanopterin reductase-like flavin-dependent oxidoreductase (luciferase family)